VISKKLYLIGDCQSTRIFEHYTDNETRVELKAWGRGGHSAWKFNPYDLLKMNRYSSLMETPKPKGGRVGWSEIQDDGIVIAWFGYIDIKYLLPKYKNAAECVKRYVDFLLQYFPNSQLILAEPHPQFKENIIPYWEEVDEYSYDERLQQNNEFCAALNEYGSALGLRIITQKEIFEATGLQQFTLDCSDKTKGHDVDGLNQELTQKLYDMFIDIAVYKNNNAVVL
jgi:hypothetical protein